MAFRSQHNEPDPNGPCVRTEPQTLVKFDRCTNRIHGKSTMSVRRPLAELKKVLDPQNWHRTVPDYFLQSCVVDVHNDSFRMGIESHAPVCVADPPAAGSAWRGVLFEHYRLTIAGYQLVEFKNLLDVKSISRSGGHRWEYNLRTVLYGRIACIESSAGLDLDDGFIELQESDDGWVDVTATKDFRLVGWGLDKLLNWWTSITIQTTLPRAYDAVCMDLEDRPPLT